MFCREVSREASSSQGSNSMGERILVVDDEATIRLVIKKVLRAP
jgi:hypothetical protein